MGQLRLKLEARKNARKKSRGRPRIYARGQEPYRPRVVFTRRRAVHVTLRLGDEVMAAVRSLRRFRAYHAIRVATVAVLGRDEFRIVHASLERDHIHLIVEADHHLALSRGVQAFEISAAQHLNRAIEDETGERRRGEVFRGRFYPRFLMSPTQARNTICYVLNNWRKHREDKRSKVAAWVVDYFSSGPTFLDWEEWEASPLLPGLPRGYEALHTQLPRGWLLRIGWRRAGPISLHAVPGPALAA